MRGPNTRSGLTLLEIIVVIMILGVIVSLALPRLMRMVEYSRATEALNTIVSLRSAMEKCGMQKGLVNCTHTSWDNIGITDPGTAPNAHWTYRVNPNFPVDGAYQITAIRNSNEDASLSAGQRITVTINPADSSITRVGTGEYLNI